MHVAQETEVSQRVVPQPAVHAVELRLAVVREAETRQCQVIGIVNFRPAPALDRHGVDILRAEIHDDAEDQFVVALCDGAGIKGQQAPEMPVDEFPREAVDVQGLELVAEVEVRTLQVRRNHAGDAPVLDRDHSPVHARPVAVDECRVGVRRLEQQVQHLVVIQQVGLDDQQVAVQAQGIDGQVQRDDVVGVFVIRVVEVADRGVRKTRIQVLDQLAVAIAGNDQDALDAVLQQACDDPLDDRASVDFQQRFGCVE